MKGEGKVAQIKESANKGEWSELYAMFKLLAEGRLYAADEKANKITDTYYDVLKVLREEGNQNLEYRREGDIVVVDADSGSELYRVAIKDFMIQANALYKGITKDHGNEKGAFELPEVWKFAKSVGLINKKAKSADKADITLMVHDIKNGKDETFGFSIKSQLGSPATLFNASGATNLTFKVIGSHLSADQIIRFNGIKKFKEKFEYLSEMGADIEFVAVDSDTFNFNLKMVTAEMPMILGEMLKVYYSGQANELSKIAEILGSRKIIGTLDDVTYLRHNIKDLLTNIALGMVPATKWTGDFEATGGYIIVKEDGDLVCYHIYNRNAFRNYMIDNTRFDTPSTSKHGFGSIYEENGEQWLKLGVQIRFVK